MLTESEEQRVSEVTQETNAKSNYTDIVLYSGDNGAAGRSKKASFSGKGFG